MYYYNVISGCKAIPGVTGFGAKRPKLFLGLPAIWKCFQDLQFVNVFSSSVGVCCLLPIMGDVNDGNRAETKSTALNAAGYACFTLKMSSHEELVTISPFDLPKITFHVSFQQIYLEHAVRSLQSMLCHPTEMLWICCITEQHLRACTMPSPFGPSSFNQPDCSTSLYCARG